MLHLQYCRLHVNAFLFLTILGNQAIDHPSFVNLYNLAALVINSTTSIYKCSASRTDYASMTMILAACIILKISRSHLADHVDVDRGRKAYFTAIAAFRDPTLRHIGISSRAAMVLMQLWGCQRLISRIEGDVDGLKLGVQSRSSMSIVFDCFLWWKEQLQGENDSCAHSAKELQEVSSTEGTFNVLISSSSAKFGTRFVCMRRPFLFQLPYEYRSRFRGLDRVQSRKCSPGMPKYGTLNLRS